MVSFVLGFFCFDLSDELRVGAQRVAGGLPAAVPRVRVRQQLPAHQARVYILRQIGVVLF